MVTLNNTEFVFALVLAFIVGMAVVFLTVRIRNRIIASRAERFWEYDRKIQSMRDEITAEVMASLGVTPEDDTE